MRQLELKAQRLNIILPGVGEAEAARNYFYANRDHLHAANPNFPEDFYTAAYWEKRLSKSLEEFSRDESVRLFLESRETPGRFIGALNFTQIVRHAFQACYAGYSIAKDFEGRGLMFEALSTGIKYMFEGKHIHRIMANYLPENTRSAAVLARLGFRIDGTSPDYLHIRGAWRTHVLTSLTNLNWTPRPEDRATFENAQGRTLT